MHFGNRHGAAVWRVGSLRVSGPETAFFPFAVALLRLDGGTIFCAGNPFWKKILPSSGTRSAVSSLGADCLDGLCNRGDRLTVLRRTDAGADDPRRGSGLADLAEHCFGCAGPGAVSDRLLVLHPPS